MLVVLVHLLGKTWLTTGLELDDVIRVRTFAYQ
jgi:hypothetical protein